MKDFKEYKPYIDDNGDLHIVLDGDDIVYCVPGFGYDFAKYLKEKNIKIVYDENGFVKMPIEVYEKYFDLVHGNSSYTYHIEEFEQFECDDNEYIVHQLLRDLTMVENVSNGYININKYIDRYINN